MTGFQIQKPFESGSFQQLESQAFYGRVIGQTEMTQYNPSLSRHAIKDSTYSTHPSVDPGRNSDRGEVLQMQPMEQEEEELQMQSLEEEEQLQMKPAIRQGQSEPIIQKQDEEGAGETSGNRNHLARLIGDLVREQLSDSGLRGHLRTLGSALRGMAVQGTSEPSGRPSGAAERLTALNIPQAFETTSRAIIQDPDLRHIRRRIAEIISTNDVTALVSALAAGMAAFLADVNLRGEPSTDLGAGFTLGGMFNLGSAQEIQFRQVQTYVQYANDHFRVRVAGGLQNVEANEETGEEEHLVGTGTGEIRVGTDVSHMLSRVSINSDGELTLTGRFSAGTQFGSNERLVFTADVSHMFATNETVFRPGVSGRFNLGSGQRLEIGSQLQVSSEEGLNRLTGFIEYQRDQLFLRIEGNMQGIPGSESISPGNEMLIQGRVIIPLF